MSLPIHVEIIGEKQGPIKGSCDMEGREGTIFVEYVNHEVQIPTGEKGGKRIHSPFIISKPIDRSSPLLEQALAESELLTKVLVKFYEIISEGHEELFYTILLEQARIKSIVLEDDTETVSFSYRKITWRWENPPIETTDSWEEPGA